MSEQYEALRLADWLERGNYNHEDSTKAAAELRRLHAVNQELLEALKLAMMDWENMRVVPPASRAHKAAHAAIAKVNEMSEEDEGPAAIAKAEWQV
jgi:hypothetical protein